MGESKKKVTRNIESSMLLNMKDIESARSGSSKIEDKKKTLDDVLEKYNQATVKALNAPIPKIKLPFSEVLLRAVPFEVKSKSGIILSAGNNMMIANQLDRMSDGVDQVQEILMVGAAISKEDQELTGIKPGNMCKFSLKRFVSLSDEHQAGNISKKYEIPAEEIDGHKYLIIDRRDIIFTKEK